MGNQNHPKKGSLIKADPIRSLEMIAAVEAYLSSVSRRDLAIFVLGVNTNLRASDLLRRTVGEVRGATHGTVIVIREKKTQKARRITLNRKVCTVLSAWLLEHPWADQDDAPLFPNLRSGQALKVPTLSRMVKGWCRAVGLEGHYSAHTLRKTFGYVHRTVHGTDLPTLMTLFNHATQRQTLDYLGIDAPEIHAAYLREV